MERSYFSSANNADDLFALEKYERSIHTLDRSAHISQVRTMQMICHRVPQCSCGQHAESGHILCQPHHVWPDVSKSLSFPIEMSASRSFTLTLQ